MKLTRLQTIYILIWTVLGTSILAIPYGIGQFTIRDGWLCVLFSLFGGGFAAVVCLIFMKTFPNLSLIEGLKAGFGPILGSVLGVWMVIWLYVTSTNVWRELSLFTESSVYSRTPLYVISAVIVLPIAYASYKGIIAIGRMAEFVLPLAIAVFVLVFALWLKDLDTSQLRPMLADGWTPVLRGSVVPSFTFMPELLTILFVTKQLASTKTLWKDIAIAALIVATITVIVEFCTIMLVGAPISYLEYPILEAVRSISVSNFIERLDTFYVMGVMIAICMKLSIFTYVFLAVVKELLQVSSLPRIAFAGSLAVWAGDLFLFRHNVDVGEYIVMTTPAYFICTMFLLPLAAVALYQIRQRLFGAGKKVPSRQQP